MDSAKSGAAPRLKWKKTAATAGAVALAAVLFAFFINRAGDMEELGAAIKSALKHPCWLAAGAGLFSLSLMSGMLRWFILLKTLRLPVPFGEAFRLYATGHFFNILGPGATGGDLVKAAWLASKIPDGQRTIAVTSIAAERLIGLMSMIVFVAGVVLFRADFFSSHPTLAIIRLCVIAAFAGAAVLFALLTAIDWEKLASRIKTREGSFAAKLLATMVKVWRTFKVCLSHPAAALGAFALSLANHAADACCYFLLSRALSMTLPFRDMIAITPIANMAAAVPLTPGGLGLRENALQTMMDMANVPLAQSSALALLMFSSIVFWALVAGCVMLGGKRRKRAA